MSFSLSGKTAIVTGSANGIGLAIGRHFIDKGANVMFADMDEKKLVAEMGDEVSDDSPMRFFAGDLRQKLCDLAVQRLDSGQHVFGLLLWIAVAHDDGHAEAEALELLGEHRHGEFR